MTYRFGSCTLDIQRRELLTAEGTIALRPKVFGLLAYLIGHRDRVVSKQELFDQLWPDVHVGDATLNTCVKSARQAVGDCGKSQAVIRTWHGHGYRFVAPVAEGPAQEGSVEEARDGDRSACSEPAAGDAPAAPPNQEARPAPAAPPAGIGSRPDPAVPADAFPSGKEHKQVTVLHCALPEASRLAARLGAEAMDETMERFMSLAEGTVQRYGGTVTQWLGDGMVALFGAPRAFEDHARRAVSASLDLLAHLTKDREGLSVRIGLHTGPVVVGTTARDPGGVYTAAGATTERAGALQEQASPATVLASEETFLTVQSEVDAEPFGVGETGPGQTAPAYVIRDLITRQSGVPRRSGRLVSRFLGRDRELAMLHDSLEGLQDGGGRVVSISGEPGIGKSRLVEEFARSLETAGSGAAVDTLRVNCLSYAGTSPYLPVRRLLRRVCSIRSADLPDQAIGKLDRCLGAAGLGSTLARALLGQVLGLPVDVSDLDRLSPQERRAQTFDHLYTIVGAACTARPCVIVVEDLHWIDATSEAWLSGLVMRLAGLRVLLLVTYRPGYQAPWLPQSSATQLALSGLKTEVAAALVRTIPTTAPLSESAMRSIVARAQGNPFFLEELAWSFGTGRYARLGIPETVQTVLADRIDRLAPVDKRLLQIAAVIGPEVSVPLLAAVDGLSDDERRDCLLRLQEAELLYERPAAPARIFAFKHALTQNVACMSLVARTRAQIHSRIAKALEAGFQPLVRVRPELLAHHLTEAGDPYRATGCWLQAGRGAIERSANAEAIAHLTKGLELLAMLPEGADRTEREIALQLTLGIPLQSTKGPGSPETERVYRRAGELCRASGDRLSLFFATFGQWRFNSAAFNMPAARDLAGSLLDLARGHEDPTLQLQAHHAHWTTLYNYGELGPAREHIERGLALYDPREHRNQAFQVAGHDPSVCAQLTASQILWITGYPDRAVDRFETALALANDLGHPSTLATALNHAVRLSLCRRDLESVRHWQQSLRTLAIEHGFSSQATWCDLVQVWLEAEETGAGAGIEEMRLVVASRPELAGVERPFARALIAAACRSAGRAADGLSLLPTAPDSAETGVTRIWDAEFTRLRGELLLALDDDHQAEAESLFQYAISTARRQDAKSLELRATASLARLWGRLGRCGKARDLLGPLYAWFTEGHDTRDLAEARALLEALSSRCDRHSGHPGVTPAARPRGGRRDTAA